MTLPWFQPEALRIPFIEGGGRFEEIVLHPFGMLVALGALVGARVATWKAGQDGLHPRAVAELGGYQLVIGFTLGHVLDALFYHWDVVVERPALLFELWNGLSSFGGFLGAGIGSAIWVRHRRASFLAFADPIAFSFPFGWLFGRIGCFLVHDHPGRPSEFFLAVEDYRIRDGVPPWLTRHDLGFYEVLWCLAMIPLFLWLGRTQRPRGFYLMILPLLYAPVRFGLDFLRATDIASADTRYLGLTPGHYGAVALAAAGIFVWRWRKRATIEVPADMRWWREGEIAEGESPKTEAETETETETESDK